MRQMERSAASSSSTDCAGIWLNCQAAAPRVTRNSARPPLKKWRQAMPAWVGTRPASAPSSGPASSAAMTARNAVPKGNAPVKITQTSSANAAGSTSERRKLSSIFQALSASMP